MGVCGCTTSCGCDFVAGPGVNIRKVGDRVYISAAQVAQTFFVQENDPGELGYAYGWVPLIGGVPQTMIVRTPGP